MEYINSFLTTNNCVSLTGNGSLIIYYALPDRRALDLSAAMVTLGTAIDSVVWGTDVGQKMHEPLTAEAPSQPRSLPNANLHAWKSQRAKPALLWMKYFPLEVYV